jgi:hypothetical protein
MNNKNRIDDKYLASSKPVNNAVLSKETTQKEFTKFLSALNKRLVESERNFQAESEKILKILKETQEIQFLIKELKLSSNRVTREFPCKKKILKPSLDSASNCLPIKLRKKKKINPIRVKKKQKFGKEPALRNKKISYYYNNNLKVRAKKKLLSEENQARKQDSMISEAFSGSKYSNTKHLGVKNSKHLESKTIKLPSATQELFQSPCNMTSLYPGHDPRDVIDIGDYVAVKNRQGMYFTVYYY